nr:5-oxoprolinase subunit PxpA [Sphaerisporangium fuscum]
MIDLNADLGEGFGIWRLSDDDALLDIVTSATVACGFHAGDPLTIRRVCAAAADRGVAIGAKVSYRDLVGFGRRPMEVDAEELCAEVLYQLAALDGVARAMGGELAYVKLHGALHERARRDAEQAEAVVAAVADQSPAVPILTLPSSELHAVAARYGVPTVNEAFADRAYLPSGEPGAELDDLGEVAARAVRLARDGVVTTDGGAELKVDARSINVRGDTPTAVRRAATVREALLAAGLSLKPFAT